ncbi:MAG: type III-B CRISPR module RAMP protein Cmr4 [Candidatus Paceibacterota bacterium]
MKTTILGLLAETAVHPGAGQDTGFVDLPVAREAATDYPVIVGSSFKGALLDRARANNRERQDSQIDCDRIFGKQDNAGSLLVSDVRLMLLPVRSLTSHYKWVTCSHLLERLQRDLKRAGCDGKGFRSPDLDSGQYLGEGEESLFLEERQFQCRGKLPDGLVDLIGSLIVHDETKKRLAEQCVILHDNDFSWFARFGLAVNARNVLHHQTKTSENLWYEETIPPDSLFYSLLADRNGGQSLKEIEKLLDVLPYIQVGGNETVGQGWFAVKHVQQQGSAA